MSINSLSDCARRRCSSRILRQFSYGHLWPDAAESTRTAIRAVIAERMNTTADQLRPTST
ncbi:hypothetical protein BB737_05865 [Mycobacterium avium subsp. hominissuis]|uniref:Uncharacterized protein n=3 Tax=Mycobacterium avium complex (MAC) TaxID=120793 RepID=A0A2A3LDD8_MYCAV|nr:hypothetical protein BS641_17485 [Mycobacterium avium subsp. hominissuis]ASE15939.1 hypothetical protein CEP84_20900 [Mycobacterium avium subsp. paratuberculosis]ETZ54542.1 phage integrase family domain protein [Mycobacterium avium MAV_120709_2344]ETZ68030.1 phage integrase family domain protein [Mycobacterium sp. MAC_080597_8934]EUA36365.1 phage integrase family domain protein [Mycobacterium avium subsp. avium 2285 (R)]ORB78111.1 hypothetical protein BST46_20930 [Mycobacterium timonense]P